jgi:hypothetical protein
MLAPPGASVLQQLDPYSTVYNGLMAQIELIDPPQTVGNTIAALLMKPHQFRF